MDFRGRFELGLAWRTIVLLAALTLLIAALATPGLAAGRIVAAGLAVAAVVGLWNHVRRTNFELARFVEAVRFGDYSQRFATTRDSGFDVLGAALDRSLKTLHDRQLATAGEARFLAAAVDDAPIALFTIADDGTVTLLSKAARRLFQRNPPTRLADFERYGAELAATLALPPGTRRVTRMVQDGVAQPVLASTARIERLNGGMTIGSLMTVQREFGQVELAAQADLVRVLTHEIMNSLTPVTSLARSGAELVARAAAHDPSLADAREAVETTAARAEGILHFVESYRDFAASPEVKARQFAARPWAEEIVQLAAADPRAGGIAVSVRVEPDGASIDGDPNLLAQVALNLIRNAALAGAARAEFRIAATRGDHVTIELADDGPGIPPDRREDVFLPFYTTRRDGSGVGLSFARQVALAHGGTIAAGESDLGGASIRLVL